MHSYIKKKKKNEKRKHQFDFVLHSALLSFEHEVKYYTTEVDFQFSVFVYKTKNYAMEAAFGPPVCLCLLKRNLTR